LKREGRKPDKPNVILLVAPTILAGLPVVHFARKWGIPSWVHVQDFEAETAAGLGILSSGVIKRAAVALEGRLLRRFLWATTVSLPMLAKLEKIRGASNSDVFPNWVEASNLQLRLASRSVRAGWNVPDNAFILLFTGSIARKQGITILVDLADRLASVVPPIFVVICGDGPEKVLLQERAQKVNNLKVFGLVPEEALPEVLATADIHILPQRPEVSDHVMPSKLLAMMASGRPVIATAPTGSAIADVLGDAGLTVPFDLDALANAVMMLAQDPDLRAKMGASGNMRAMAYEKDLVLCRIEQKMIERVNSHKV
jgi:colanic acid biosynthesis glycosyl transferase WcaI